MERPRSEAIAAFDRVLEKGTRRLTGEEIAQLRSDVEGTALEDLPDQLEQIRKGKQPPKALLKALETLRQNAIATIAPPRLAKGVRGKKLERRINELNATAGGWEPPRKASGHLLEQLSAMPAYATAQPISRSTDVTVLWCLVRTGRIAERRAAVARLGRLIVDDNAECEGFDEKELVAGLSAIRDPRIAFEVDVTLAAVAGSEGRAARQRLTRVDRLLAKVLHRARRYWAGDEEIDPLTKLSREQSLRLGVWLRRADDQVAAHVAEHLRLLAGRSSSSKLADAIGAFIPSGDDRLVPTLCRILADAPLAARIATARALGRIADPRVHRALVKAYRHATDITEKTVLGGALGQCNDERALPFLLERLQDDEPAIWEEAVRSVGSLGAPEAAPLLLPLLDSGRTALTRAIARALVRCGGPSALEALRQHAARRRQHSSLLNDAADALALRLQLLGKIQPEDDLHVMPAAPQHKEVSLAANEPPAPEPAAMTRLRSVGHHALGLFWSALWQRSRALASFKAAAQIHPLAASPHLHMAMLYSANNRDDLAIESYRRALIANKRWVLRRPSWVRRLLRSYLRRADSLVARRRKREALGLLDEVASLDLRQADLDLRLATTRRRDRLLVDRARKRLADK